MSQEIVQVDAFADKPFAGNPAAVCVMSSPADEEWMQLVAREMNLSETAFLYPVNDGYHLRWFTPIVEVELCGHATLASSHVLFEDGHVQPDTTIRFHTKSGELKAMRDGKWIELDFPANALSEAPPPAGLLEAVGVSPKFVGKHKSDYFIEVESDSVVRALEPDIGSVAALPVHTVCVTAADTTGETDFVSRFFAPAMGVAEDPVTGFAHTVLTPYWAGRLGKSEFIARQVSKRGGLLRLRLDGDRVRIGGQAVTVMRGQLL